MFGGRNTNPKMTARNLDLFASIPEEFVCISEEEFESTCRRLHRLSRRRAESHNKLKEWECRLVGKDEKINFLLEKNHALVEENRRKTWISIALIAIIMLLVTAQLISRSSSLIPILFSREIR
jgi:hypothetical protein